MTTMYDIIMDLPLFRGISRAQVSAFLEKTNVEFINYKDGEILQRCGDEPQHLIYLIRGKVCAEWRNDAENVRICYMQRNGSMLGATHLFGMVRQYSTSISATGSVSVLRISKSQYINILLSDKIFLFNYLNYLSAAVQRCETAIRRQGNSNFRQLLTRWIAALIPYDATEISIYATESVLCALAGIRKSALKEEIAVLSADNLIRPGRGRLEILSRSGLLESNTPGV